MITIILYGGGALLLVAILLSLPLVKHVASPFVDASIAALGLLLKHVGSYFVWISKAVVVAHLTLLKHLIYPKKHFDITHGVEKSSK